MSLKIAFPISTGIDNIVAQLYSYPGNLFIQQFSFLNGNFDDEGTNYSVTFVNNVPLSSGAYQLVINFTRETKDAGTFREAINIWDNVVSDRRKRSG